MTIPALDCPWDVAYSDVQLYCPSAPAVDDSESPAEGTITTEQAEAVVAAATAAVWEATGRRYGICTRTARPCSHRGRCAGACGAFCCSSTHYDRLDLDPLGRAPVRAVRLVTESGDVLTEQDFALVDARWLLRTPTGTRWPTRTDIAGSPPDIEITWEYGTAPSADLLTNGVVPLACELAKKAAGLQCSIPDNVITVSREGAQFVMTDLTALVTDGHIGPPSVIAAIRRAHPYGPAVGQPGGMLNPARVVEPVMADVSLPADLAPLDDEFDRTQGDVWTWDWTTDDDISDWSNLVVVIRDAPTTSGAVVATTADASIVTTDTDWATGRVWWQTAVDTSTVAPGTYWIEAAADVPAEGGAFTFMPARRLLVRPQVAG